MKNNNEVKLRKSLERAIQEWANSVCEGEDWEKGFGEYVSDNFAELMSVAAFAVLIGMRDGQRYINEENLEMAKQ